MAVLSREGQTRDLLSGDRARPGGALRWVSTDFAGFSVHAPFHLSPIPTPDWPMLSDTSILSRRPLASGLQCLLPGTTFDDADKAFVRFSARSGEGGGGGGKELLETLPLLSPFWLVFSKGCATSKTGPSLPRWLLPGGWLQLRGSGKAALDNSH